ncbi:hypothetical protein [Fodinicola feengrottensis]
MPRPERPLDTVDSALVRFAADLRAVREKAGSPPYRELSRRAHFSAGTLSDAAGGRKLPSLAVTLAYVRACDGDDTEWEQRWHAVAAAVAAEASGAESEAEPDPHTAPYVGLAAFQPADADRFYGREDLVDEISRRLERQRFLAVFGASGAGKSSVLRAGLVPRFGATESRPVLLLSPGARPLQELALAVATATGRSASAVRTELDADPASLHLIVRQLVSETDDDVLIVVDQFEELFTLCPDKQERERFVDCLLYVVKAPTSRVRVVIGVRTDFFTHCVSHQPLAEALQDAQLLVTPLTADQLRQVTTRPATLAGYVVEGALLARVVADSVGQPAVLPLVSHALLETWRRRRGNTLTLAGYEAAGGIVHAVAQTADAVYRDLDAAQRKLAKDLFLRLTALGEGTEDTRRRIDRAELCTDRPQVEVLLERLVAARLITVDAQWIEVTHEALIRSWPRLREWLAEDRDGLRIHRSLTVAAAGWESLDQDPGALYRGARLAAVRDWMASHDAHLTGPEQRFLTASEAAETAENTATRRRTRRLRQLVALLTVALVLLTTATGFATYAEGTANQQRDRAQADSVAQQATALRATNPALAAQLSLAAYRLSPTTAARSSLVSTLAQPYATALTGHTDSVEAAAYSPNGKVLATAGVDESVRLWSVTDPHHPSSLALLTGHSNVVNAVAFSPDGTMLASAGSDGTVRLWGVANPRHPVTEGVLRCAAAVTSVAFAPDGRTLAAAQENGATQLWLVGHPRLAGTIPGTAAVLSVAFGHDGGTLATATADHLVRLWDVADLSHPTSDASLTGAADSVNSVAFSPDGRELAGASRDHTVRLWDVAVPSQPSPLATVSQDNQVLSVAFSPDGRTIATGAVDHTVRRWDLTDPRQPVALPVLGGQTDEINAVAFSPDGRTLATASSDHTVWLHDLPGPMLAGHTDTVNAAAYSPNGGMAATAGADGTTRLWNVTDPDHPGAMAVLTGPATAVFGGNAIFGLAFSPNGRTLAVARNDATVQLWNIAQPRDPVRLGAVTGHTAAVFAVAFSPDGRTLATGSVDGTARIWDLADPTHPAVVAVLPNSHSDGALSLAYSPDGRTLAVVDANTIRLWKVADPHHWSLSATLGGHGGAVQSVMFGRDGRLLVSGGNDRTVRLWDVSNGSRPAALATLVGPTDAVDAVAVSPDDQTVAAASADHTVVLWDIANLRQPSPLATLSAATGSVRTVAFGPDSHRLISAGDDETAVLWQTDPDQVANQVCALVSPQITKAQWNQYFPGMRYSPPCRGSFS